MGGQVHDSDGSSEKRGGAIEHAVPAYVPEANGRPTHYVEFDYPRQRGDSVTVSESVPCRGLGEAREIERTNRKLGMKRVRVLTYAEKHGARS